MSDDLVKRLRAVTAFVRLETGDRVAAAGCLSEEAASYIEAIKADLQEMTRRRDEWREKAKGHDALSAAVRAKATCDNRVSLSRALLVGALVDVENRLTAEQVRSADMAGALRSIAANTCCDGCQEAAMVAQAALRGTIT